MKPFLIIQNDAGEGAGQLQTLLDRRQLLSRVYLGWEAQYTELDESDYSALIVLGGAQGVYEADQYPYLLDEIKLSQAFINADKPVIGLCLGAQILATALGGQVEQNTRKEIGWFEIELSKDAAEDDLLKGLPQRSMAFHFHGDYFKLPEGCVGLARSALTECQLFRYKQNVYGFQYHAEVDLPLIDVMCRSNEAYMQDSGYDLQAVLDETQEYLDSYLLRCESILERWIDKALNQ